MRLLAASAALLVAWAVPAAAADTPLVIADVAGDANFVNDGGEFTTGNQSTATSQPSLDLRQVALAPVRSAGTTTGFTLTLSTYGELRDRTQLSVTTRTQHCADLRLTYVHREADPVTLLSSGCSSGTVRLPTRVEASSITVTVPFSALPERARQDRVLQRVHAFSQIHLAGDPLLRRQPVGTSMVDTTTQDVRYRMR